MGMLLPGFEALRVTRKLFTKGGTGGDGLPQPAGERAVSRGGRGLQEGGDDRLLRADGARDGRVEERCRRIELEAQEAAGDQL